MPTIVLALAMIAQPMPADGPVPRPTATTGRVAGRLTWGGAAVPPSTADWDGLRADSAAAYPDRPDDLRIDPATRGIAHGFAFLVDPKGDYTATERRFLDEHPTVTIRSRGQQITPFAAIAHRDQVPTYVDDDPEGHILRVDNFIIEPGRMLPEKGNIDQSRYLAGKFHQAGPRHPILRLSCDIHPIERSYFLKVAHPFATTTQADGSFKLVDVPTGEQRLVVWHPAGGWLTPNGLRGMPITVPDAGGVADIGALVIRPASKKKNKP